MMNLLDASALHMKQTQPQKVSDPSQSRKSDDSKHTKHSDEKSVDEVENNETSTTQQAGEPIFDFENLMEGFLAELPTGSENSEIQIAQIPTINPSVINQNLETIDQTYLVGLNALQNIGQISTDAQALQSADVKSALEGSSTIGTIKGEVVNQSNEPVASSTIKLSVNSKADFSTTDDTLKSASNFSKAEGELTFTKRAGLIKAGEGRVENIPGNMSSQTHNQNSLTMKLASIDPSAQVAQMALSGDAPLDQSTSSQQQSVSIDTGNVTQAAKAASDPVVAHRAINMAGLEIARAAIAGRNRFDIRLDPAELGRIEVRLIMEKEKMQAKLTIERPETLDMMMRDRTQLERLLSATGIELSEDGIDMQLKKDDQNDQNNFAQLMDQKDDQSGMLNNLANDEEPLNELDEAHQLVTMSHMQMNQHISKHISDSRSLNWMA